VKEDEVDRACSTDGREVIAYRISVGRHEEKKQIVNLDIDGTIILWHVG
jgi:hypothetical protein